jgi:hypothetical protein
MGSAGFGGGIIQLAAGCEPAEQKNGMGMTVYYWVNSVDEVRKPSLISQYGPPKDF